MEGLNTKIESSIKELRTEGCRLWMPSSSWKKGTRKIDALIFIWDVTCGLVCKLITPMAQLQCISFENFPIEKGWGLGHVHVNRFVTNSCKWIWNPDVWYFPISAMRKPSEGGIRYEYILLSSLWYNSPALHYWTKDISPVHLNFDLESSVLIKHLYFFLHFWKKIQVVVWLCT